MRVLIATLILLSGTFAMNSTADAARRAKRSANSPYYYTYPRDESECERRARAEDPSGQYAGYPCWAREIFGRGGSGRGGR